MRYLDANVFVRYITRDEPEMSVATAQFFKSVAGGDEEVLLLEATVAEIVYVLRSQRLYNLPNVEVRDRLSALVSERGILMEHKDRCLRALDLYASHPDLKFGDALLAAAVEEQPDHEVYSYDRGFDRIEGIRRVEP